MAATMTPFGGPYRNVRDLVALVKSRGLVVYDDSKAERYLTMIGYYRLSAYMVPLMRVPKSLKLFKSGASFRQVMMLYRFDKKLRMLMLTPLGFSSFLQAIA